MTTEKEQNKKSIEVKAAGVTGSVTKTKKQKSQPVVVDVQVTVLPPSRQEAVHPAQHFDIAKKRMYFGFQLPVEIDSMDGKPPKRRIVNCLVDDRGHTIPCIESELQANGITLMAEPLIDTKHGNRISDIVLEEWQRTGGKKPVPWDLPSYLEFVMKCLREMIDFTNDDGFYYLALWIFGTYCHRLFESFPYDFYNGPTGTGKTRTLEVCDMTAFNAVLSPNMSPSSLFRTVESRAPTLLMDETEKLWSSDQAQEIRQLVLSGYKRGAAVLRTEKIGDSGFQTNTFGTYSPKAFANISGLDDVLQNRCITTLMTRSKELNVMNARLLTKSRKDKWQDIRNQSYLLVYRHWLRIAEIVEAHADIEVVEGVNGRPLELWGPMFVLAELFEENGCTGLKDKMKELALAMVAEVTENFKDSSSGQLIRAIKCLMMNNDAIAFENGYYRFQDLLPLIAVEATFAEEGVDSEEDGTERKTSRIKKPRWLTPNYVTRQLRLLGMSDFKGSGSNRQVYLTKEKLIDIWQRYMGEWEEPSSSQTTLDQNGQSPNILASTVSARARPPLSEDVLTTLLESRGYTEASLEVEVIGLGYTKEEFVQVFANLKGNKSLEATGSTPTYYRWRKS